MPRRELRPSLTQALLRAAEEAVELMKLGERVVYVDCAGPNRVWLATDSEHHTGVVIFGFTDEES